MLHSVPPPYAPMDLQAVSVSTSTINLSWNAPQQNGTSGSTVVVGYKIERSGDAGSTWSTLISDTGTTSTVYTDSGISSGTQESYRVLSIGPSGAVSSPSNTASATTLKTDITAPTIAISSNTAFVGNDLRVTGFRFAPNAEIALSYDNSNFTEAFSGPALVPSTLMTNSSGNFVVIVPAVKSDVGIHTITARDSMNNVASQTITILPHVLISPSSGYAGSQVLVPSGQGNGFTSNSIITVVYDSSILAFSPVTDSQGSFGSQFTIPAGSPIGLHTLKFSDNKGNSYTTSFLVTGSTAPTYYYKSLVSGFNLAASLAFIPDKGPNVDGSGNLMVIEKNSGNVFVIRHYDNGTFARQTVPFVTIPNVESGFEDNGLLGITFDPDYVHSKYVYFYVTRNESGSVVGDVIRYQAMNDSSGNIVANPAVGEQVVMGNIPNWQDGHNGGSLRFDASGNLYISVSDGWVFANGQDLTSLQAKILRITPLASPVNGSLYSIPSTNPFASSADPSIHKEIWGYGIRNVFTFDIDKPTGKIYASDVGYATWERIDNFTSPGRNAGWPVYEAPMGLNTDNLSNYSPQIYWYPHDGMRPLAGPEKNLVAIQGAAFYHGSYYPGLDGAYIFGDYGVGLIQAMLPQGTAPAQMDYVTGTPKAKVVPLLYGLPTFAPEGLAEWNGQIYFIDMSGLNVIQYDANSNSASAPCTTCTLAVNSQYDTGDLLTGMYAELRDGNGTLLSSGSTPVTFAVHNGTQYSVGMGLYQNYVFDHWLDTGTTDNPRVVTLGTNTLLTAVYRDADLTVSPAEGPFGGNVTVTGAGFTPHQNITLTYDAFPVKSHPSSIIADSTGAFVVTMTVPSGSVGPHRVQASDGSNVHATVYTVGYTSGSGSGGPVTIPTSVRISIDHISNLSPKWGESITISGTLINAASNDSVSIDWGDGSPLTTGVTANASSGVWGPTSHQYNSSAVAAIPENIVAKVVDRFSGTVLTQSTPAPITVKKHTSSLTLGVIENVVQGSTVKVQGKLIDLDVSGNLPISDMNISFSGNGTAGLLLATTSVNGSFSYSGVSPTHPGNGWVVLAAFAGNPAYAASNSSATYNTNPTPSQLSLNTMPSVGPSTSITVSGSLKANSVPIGGATITLSGNGATGMKLSTITNSNGAFSITGVSPPIAASNWQVFAHYAGNASLGSSDASTQYSTVVIFQSFTGGGGGGGGGGPAPTVPSVTPASPSTPPVQGGTTTGHSGGSAIPPVANQGSTELVEPHATIPFSNETVKTQTSPSESQTTVQKDVGSTAVNVTNSSGTSANHQSQQHNQMAAASVNSSQILDLETIGTAILAGLGAISAGAIVILKLRQTGRIP